LRTNPAPIGWGGVSRNLRVPGKGYTFAPCYALSACQEGRDDLKFGLSYNTAHQGADPVPLENRIRLVTCKSLGCQATREYSLIRPPRAGFR
jgi:hypothetical protein